MGKGDGRRVENPKLIEQNWDRIFGRKEKPKPAPANDAGHTPEEPRLEGEEG